MSYYLIYKTITLVNNKFYIGKHQTDDLDDNYLGSGIVLQHAIKKYGRESFKREILEYCDNVNLLNEREIYYVNTVIQDENCYNIAKGGQGGCIVLYEGSPIRDEVCKKISDTHLKNSEKISERTKQLHIDKRCGMYGKTHSEETKQKMSSSGKGRIFSEEHRQNLSKANKGKPHPKLRGRKLSEETKQKIRDNRPNTNGENNPMFGKTQSEETKQKIREKALTRPKVICEYCNKEILKTNYARWHGDNCKANV